MPEGFVGAFTRDDRASSQAREPEHLGITIEDGGSTEAIASAAKDRPNRVGAGGVGTRDGVEAIGDDGNRITITSSSLVMVKPP